MHGHCLVWHEAMPAWLTAALNRAVEGIIARCPAQYLWGYNRYKVPAGAEPPVTAA